MDVPLTDSVEPAFMAEVGVAKDNRDPFVPSHLPAYPPKYTYSRISSKKRPLDSQAKAEAKALESKEKKQQQVKSARHSLAKIEDSVDHMS
ncbi:hypothetical protein EON65_41930 [archaeon]|nr:MAG: hypothetical protein EON65_41930 [archaeon]